MIWAAILIECFQQSWADVGILMFLQLLNGLIGWHEETKAKNAMEALQKNMAADVTVMRDVEGKETPVSISVREVTVGDKVELLTGNKIPCDVVVLSTAKNEPMEVNLSAINGEVVPRK